jgi:Zn-dependent protease
MINFNLNDYIIHVLVVVISIAFHEFGHAIAADKLGDLTPRYQGRITLWPDKHLDPLGFVMILVTSLGMPGLGWGKPVLCNPSKFKNPRSGMMLVAVAGPAMNLALALVFGLMLRAALNTSPDPDAWMQETLAGKFAFNLVWINLVLLFFNLIPIHPLDGGKIFSGFLPASQARAYDRFMGAYGMIILLVLVMSGTLLSSIISPPVNGFFKMITGY